MKRIISILAILFVITFSAQAQELHYDSSAGRTYVNIVPEAWVKLEPNVTRLYVWVSFDDLSFNATMQWELRATVVLDKNTVQYPVVASGSFLIKDDDYENWDLRSKYLFTLIAAPEKLNLKIID